jgi:hypothetical protein
MPAFLSPALQFSFNAFFNPTAAAPNLIECHNPLKIAVSDTGQTQ